MFTKYIFSIFIYVILCSIYVILSNGRNLNAMNLLLAMSYFLFMISFLLTFILLLFLALASIKHRLQFLMN